MPWVSRLAVILESRGMTLSRLAEESGISLNAVSLIATGRKVPSLLTALRVVEVLKVEVEELFGEDA